MPLDLEASPDKPDWHFNKPPLRHHIVEGAAVTDPASEQQQGQSNPTEGLP